MAIISRGFKGRRPEVDPSRLPPGHYLTHDFPVLSAGPTPRVPLDTWSFEVTGLIDEPRSWSWDELNSLPTETVTPDIHCVPKWSKLGTTWTGVSPRCAPRRCRDRGDPCHGLGHGGYTTNLPLADVTGGKAWIATGYDNEPLAPEHGGPARLLVPHLYFWKSAKWVRGLELLAEDRPGFWERNGYHIYGDPWREQRYWGD